MGRQCTYNGRPPRKTSHAAGEFKSERVRSNRRSVEVSRGSRLEVIHTAIQDTRLNLLQNQKQQEPEAIQQKYTPCASSGPSFRCSLRRREMYECQTRTRTHTCCVMHFAFRRRQKGASVQLKRTGTRKHHGAHIQQTRHTHFVLSPLSRPLAVYTEAIKHNTRWQGIP